MIYFSVNLLGLRVVISCIGLVGNVFLILAIIQTKLARVKSFELFLLGLSTANLEEIVIVNIYDIIILQTPSSNIKTWLCRTLQFLTMFGEIASILFTVLICIFRAQKLREVEKRVKPIYLDNARSALMVSGLLVMLATLLCIPVFAIKLQGLPGNTTRNSSSCPPNFFHCIGNDCPIFNRVYKYTFILVCFLLPLIIVTVTSCLIIAVLLNQGKTVTPGVSEIGSSQFSMKNKVQRLQRSTIAVLAAMGLFQVDWSLYLIFQLTVSPTDFAFWAETEFFLTTSYTSISPYVYGFGNSLFLCKNFIKK
ncbi:hypothetical protein PBY51_006995 [Eleginops maclovinus]|uniref:G-protein coupled receptors family 1 profile domain-containing protein n=1 Tax=Eleginops maclovinus TaxID=56733 RepID=A0AAN8AAT4_ELEMC|nr:hypothetical protein PBY51_006995 [Eleginops maclovinus]